MGCFRNTSLCTFWPSSMMGVSSSPTLTTDWKRQGFISSSSSAHFLGWTGAPPQASCGKRVMVLNPGSLHHPKTLWIVLEDAGSRPVVWRGAEVIEHTGMGPVPDGAIGELCVVRVVRARLCFLGREGLASWMFSAAPDALTGYRFCVRPHAHATTWLERPSLRCFSFLFVWYGFECI